MDRIIVIGCPGSGKSTFSKALHQTTGIPLVHLDMLYWKPDRTTVERTVFRERLAEVMKGSRWIIDGNYSATMEMRMEACDTVIFLDYPVALCLEGVRARRGTSRSDLPWVEQEEDEEFIRYVKDFESQCRPQILELLASCPDKNIHIFTSRTQADDFLREQIVKKSLLGSV